MPLTIVDLVYGLLLPALTAAVLAIAATRLTANVDARSAGVAVAFVAGFLVGYALLGLGPLQPSAHWHWLPWTVLLGLIGVLAPAPGGHTGRPGAPLVAVLIAVAVAISGWVLVPDWPDLAPPASVYWIGWTIYVVAVGGMLSVLLRPGPATGGLPTVWVASVMLGTLLATAAVLALSGSLRFAQMAGCGAGAALGITCAAAIDRHSIELSRVSLPLTMLAAGAMLVGRVNSFSDVPLIAYALVPLAPLALSAAAADRLQRISAGKRTAIAVGAAVAMGVVAVAIAAIAEWPMAGEAY